MIVTYWWIPAIFWGFLGLAFGFLLGVRCVLKDTKCKSVVELRRKLGIIK